jgi:hypothetical protein
MKTNQIHAKSLLSRLLVAVSFTALSTSLMAAPEVTYKVTGGGPFDYMVDLTVNNTRGSGDIWDIGLYLGGSADQILSDPTGSPAGFNVNGLNWQDLSASALPVGTTLSGFVVPFDTPVPPRSADVGYTLYEGGSPYLGGATVLTGFASPASAPDSGTTMTLLGLAVGALGCVSRRIRKA